ncbi:hypothetical protein QTH34_02130 [Clostridium perfringens]|uniref:Phage protein n=1 Tax=Clostridium perfringens TaxID=1502 RepID=A0AAV6F209_CLOPF|nr:hypothetical protein [Clostridium perfringens]WEV17036.1 hypothetical protein PL325_05445 [Clostridium perfringens D]STB11451.1 Uncharacterised protein [Clostridium novyi]AQW26301.1 hypothetical protein BXT94_05790 [Clostridium perfringens]EGT0692231.1 hypothetical protein [Clostridium perfringens]EHP50516.1 hypothetical protein HMPREF9476_00468 [Clostridium perfringens WAL-14572]
MKKLIIDSLLLFLIAFLLAAIVWWTLGFKFVTVALVGYGLLLEAFSLFSSKKRSLRKNNS